MGNNIMQRIIINFCPICSEKISLYPEKVDGSVFRSHGENAFYSSTPTDTEFAATIQEWHSTARLITKFPENLWRLAAINKAFRFYVTEHFKDFGLDLQKQILTSHQWDRVTTGLFARVNLMGSDLTSISSIRSSIPLAEGLINLSLNSCILPAERFLSQLVSGIPTLRYLSLAGVQVTTNHIFELSSSLRESQPHQLSELNLSYVCYEGLNNSAGNILLWELGSSQNVKVLYLLNNRLTSEQIVCFSQSIRHGLNSPLEVLDLSENMIEKGLKFLAAIHPRLCALKKLILTSNSIDDQSAQVLARVLLQFSNLKYLALSENPLTRASGGDLIKFIRQHPAQPIFLSPFEGDEYEALVHALSREERERVMSASDSLM
ncbi:MAG: hypothetical protein K0M45_02330 [Candidatus Paracaedibacteraceae bacterium]|nr:hypothetical protein [Candidatus Paracaedibacteraceae bacterium]